jgi:hypothetical protein
MDTDVIKEFLVGLGFKVDANGLKTFMGTLEGVTKAALAVGVGVTAAAVATVAAVSDISEKFEDLYYASQRIKSSVSNIQGYSFSIGQLGGHADEALGSLEGLASFLRSNPGGEKFLQSMGVATRDAKNNVRDTVDIFDDLGKRFKTMPFYRQKVYAGILGIDEKTLIAMTKDVDKFKDKYAEMYRAAGVDPEKAAAGAVVFMNKLRDLRAEGGVLAVMFGERLAPAAYFFVGAMENGIWVLEKLDQVTGGLTTDFISVAIAMGVASKAAKFLGLDLMALLGKALAPLMLRLAVFAGSLLPAVGDAIMAVAAAIEVGGVIAFGWIALIIAAIVALAYGVYKLIENWDDVAAFFGRMWDDVVGFFKDAAAWIAKFVGQMGPDALKSAWGGITGFFTEIWDSLTATFKAGWDRIKPYVEAMARLIKRDWAKFVGQMGPDALKSAWGGITGFFTEIWDSLTATFKAGWDRIKPYVEAMARLIKRDWAGALGAVAGGVVGFAIAGPVGAVAGAVAGGALADKASTPEGRKALTEAVKGAGKDAMAFFQKAGWTAAQAAGIVANIHRESGFKAGAVGDGGRAFGLGQWHPDRQRAFAAFAGHDIQHSTAQEQLAFINYELTKGSEKMAGNILRATKGAFAAGAVVSRHYERPGNADGEASARGALAEGYFGGTNLAPAGGKKVTIHQTNKTDINVHGSTSPHETAKAVSGTQDRVHGDAIRNLKGALI